MKRKKKQGCIFFSQENFISHSFRIWWVFLFFFLKMGMFWFSTFFYVFSVFFSCKSSQVIHSFDLEAVFFFSVNGKKYSFFIHSIDFPPKFVKNELLQVKKNTIALLPRIIFMPQKKKQKSLHWGGQNFYILERLSGGRLSTSMKTQKNLINIHTVKCWFDGHV